MATYQKLPEAEAEFGTHGLTTEQALAQQKKWGKNEIPEEKEPVSVIILVLSRCVWRSFCLPRAARA